MMIKKIIMIILAAVMILFVVSDFLLPRVLMNVPQKMKMAVIAYTLIPPIFPSEIQEGT